MTNTRGGVKMVYGYGRGFGGRGSGYGFGFRGSSPPWPYAGRGRGGLPRCWSPGLMGGTSASNMNHEQELEMLKSHAQTMREQLEQLENRMKELGKEA